MPRLNVLGLCCFWLMYLFVWQRHISCVVYLRDGKILEFGDSVPILA